MKRTMMPNKTTGNVCRVLSMANKCLQAEHSSIGKDVGEPFEFSCHNKASPTMGTGSAVTCSSAFSRCC